MEVKGPRLHVCDSRKVESPHESSDWQFHFQKPNNTLGHPVPFSQSHQGYTVVLTNHEFAQIPAVFKFFFCSLSRCLWDTCIFPPRSLKYGIRMARSQGRWKHLCLQGFATWRLASWSLNSTNLHKYKD